MSEGAAEERTVAELVDAACEGRDNWVAVASALREQPAELTALLEPFVAAFEYSLVGRDAGERRERFGPFAPMLEWDGGTYPPPLTAAPSEWGEQWATVADSSTAAAARSRLNDLLWVLRWGDQPYRRAQSAVDDYFAVAGDWADLYAAQCLQRSLELSHELNDRERQATSVRALLDRAQQAIESEEWKPGVPLHLIATLLTLPPADQPVEIDAILLSARTRYEADPWIIEVVIDFQAQRAVGDDALITELRREQVARWREESSKGDALLKLAHLQHALERAQLGGLADEANEIRLALQAIDPEDLGLKKISASAEIPAEQVEAFIAELSGSSWETGLANFGAFGPPTGDYETAEATVRELMQRYPIQHVLTSVVLGPENSVIKQLATAEEKFAAQLASHATQILSFYSVVFAEALDRIGAHPHRPDSEALTRFYESEVISAEGADAFARALLLYWDGFYDEAAHVAVPRIEAAIRELCRRLGLVVIRQPLNDRPGGVRSLGELLQELRGHLDESWRRYLWVVLAEPLGVNLRNLISHGLVGNRVGAPPTALLLHAAGFLRGISFTAPTTD